MFGCVVEVFRKWHEIVERIRDTNIFWRQWPCHILLYSSTWFNKAYMKDDPAIVMLFRAIHLSAFLWVCVFTHRITIEREIKIKMKKKILFTKLISKRSDFKWICIWKSKHSAHAPWQNVAGSRSLQALHICVSLSVIYICWIARCHFYLCLLLSQFRFKFVFFCSVDSFISRAYAHVSFAIIIEKQRGVFIVCHIKVTIKMLLFPIHSPVTTTHSSAKCLDEWECERRFNPAQTHKTIGIWAFQRSYRHI